MDMFNSRLEPAGLTFEEMVAFLKEKHIALYKLPERLEILDKLPMVSEQKVDKKVLKQDILNKLGLGTGDAKQK
jgi:non-ribosomal peptide synthetase component E (peptide arylation enzyme)